MAVQNETRKAFHELLDLLREVDERWLGPEWMIQSSEDVADGMRAAIHMLQGALVSHFEDDPDHPLFRRIVSPTRKFTGDNADAIYYDAAVRGERRYRVRGRMDGAVFLGGPPQARNWIALPADATRITTRHYFEEERCAAADPTRHLGLEIEALDPGPPPPRPSDDSVAAGLRRVATFVRTRTLEQAPPGKRPPTVFVSTTPNQFPKPVKPGDMGLAAADAAYSMAPYLLGPDQALVVRARWPRCRCANVDLWTRHMQTYDYANRRVSLNRKQTRVDPDGSFRVVIAHRDPGVPNWLDTEGRPFGMVFWRFMLPEGEIETPAAEVVPFDQAARKA